MEDRTCYKSINGELREILSSDELLKSIQNKLEDDQYLINRWKSLYEESIKNTYKDSELIRLKKEIEDLKFQLSHGFGITQEERTRIDGWIKHNNIHNVTYRFTPTPIGVCGEVMDNKGHNLIFKEIG